MTQFTNLFGIDLSMAVWLVHDDYDFQPADKSISATALLKPTRQIILSNRITTEATEDLSSRIAIRLGHAIHDSVERAWKDGYERNLSLLGIPDKVIERFSINPDIKDVTEDTIPVWIEQRGHRMLDGWRISGKLDMSLNYRLKDTKSTSVFSYIKGSKDEQYSLQMSIYKWIHSEKVKDDEGDIQFVFTDWRPSDVNTINGYPPVRVVSHTVALYDEQGIEDWMRAKISELVRYWDAPQASLPRCTDEELWRTEPQYKYYSDPNKTDGRATKNFSDMAEANRHLVEKGKGVIKTIPGKVKACLYCPAFEDCEQRKEYDFDD